ncbi:hypothetical protein KC315_g9391 [Hortaea werneckii]|nr:hypothetical protein KC315_g9391 [Hortaea werneckii]KAI7368524.1 hypothetical protein KC354_g2599 [Hortaea werneckii]
MYASVASPSPSRVRARPPTDVFTYALIRRGPRFQTGTNEYTVLRPAKPQLTYMNHGVYVVCNTATRQVFVAKRIDMQRGDTRDKAVTERDALMQIKRFGGSNHIIDLIETFWDGTSPASSLILEYCDHSESTVAGHMTQHLHQSSRIPEPQVWHVLAGLIKALCFLHHGMNIDIPGDEAKRDWNTICHLNIKPSHVFLTTKGRNNAFPRVVLGDFSNSISWYDIKRGHEDRGGHIRGTPGWLPPELANPSLGDVRGRYGMPTDVWQVAAVAQVMCRLTPEPVQWLADEKHPCGRHYSAPLNELVSALMAGSLDRRPRAQDVLGILQEEVEMRGLSFYLR